MSSLARLQSPSAVQAAMDEFEQLGRETFLERYGFGRARDYLVRNPRTGTLCDSKAIAGVAFGKQYPKEGALRPSDFAGGDATVAPKLQSLGFEMVRIGEDWSREEVGATVAAYFEMLELEARQDAYNKSERNSRLRQHLKGRSKAAVELKHQNISAVLRDLGLPFVAGYKPRSNVQLLLRIAVQQFIRTHPDPLTRIVDAMEEVRAPGDALFQAVVVTPPAIEDIVIVSPEARRLRVPRKIDFAARDEANRRLGRAGEQWVLSFEQHRLQEAGLPELFEQVEWISERRGDGAGYDILSYDRPSSPRYIEVKTTNGAMTTPFTISRNELEFANESGPAFFLYRVFQFRDAPRLFMLQGDPAAHLHLEPMDYRATFQRILSS